MKCTPNQSSLQADIATSWRLDPLFRQSERRALTPVLLSLRGVRLLQLGYRESIPFASCSIPHCICINGGDLHAQAEALPFPEGCFDAVLLIHALEISSHPLTVLQEVSRTLAPEGHLVIAGSNPWTLWRWGPGKSVSSSRFITLTCLYDWLSALHFRVLSSQHFCFRPALANERVMRSLAFLETLGQWGLPLGRGYLVVAQKKTIPLTPTPLEFSFQPLDCRLGWAESSASEVNRG